METGLHDDHPQKQKLVYRQVCGLPIDYLKVRITDTLPEHGRSHPKKHNFF